MDNEFNQANSQIGGPQIGEPWNPKFSMSSMLLVMLVCCAMAAEFYYLSRYLRTGNRIDQLTFILFTLAGPGALFVAANLFRRIAETLARPSVAAKYEYQNPKSETKSDSEK